MATGRCAIKLERGEAPERGTIAKLVALGGLVRREARCALRVGYRCVAANTHASVHYFAQSDNTSRRDITARSASRHLANGDYISFLRSMAKM